MKVKSKTVTSLLKIPPLSVVDTVVGTPKPLENNLQGKGWDFHCELTANLCVCVYWLVKGNRTVPVAFKHEQNRKHGRGVLHRLLTKS